MLGWLDSNRRWLVLSALVLLNVVLITLLIVQRPTTVAVPAVATTSSASPTTSPRATARTPSEPKTPAAASSPSPTISQPARNTARRLLAANSSTIAWRAKEGDCDHRSTVEVTTDGGRTWRTTNPGIRGIVRLSAYGEGSVFAVGADADCKPTYAWISSPGGKWRQDQAVIWDVWFRYPSDRTRVHAPGGRTFRPCRGEISSFAGIGSYQAAVLCEDGRVRTLDRGRGWRTVLINSGGLVVNADTQRFLLARIRPQCDRTFLQQFDVRAAKLNDRGACRGPRPGHDDQVGAAGAGEVHWVWVGRSIEVS